MGKEFVSREEVQEIVNKAIVAAGPSIVEATIKVMNEAARRRPSTHTFEIDATDHMGRGEIEARLKPVIAAVGAHIASAE